MDPTASGVLFLVLLALVVGVLGLSLWLARPGQSYRLYFMGCAALILLGIVVFVAFSLQGGSVDGEGVLHDPPFPIAFLLMFLGMMGVAIRLLVSAMVTLFLKLRARHLSGG